jgi:hypothetical protein
MLLMKLQPLRPGQAMLTGFGIVAIHMAKHLQYVAAVVGEVCRHLHELPSSMREAVPQQDLYSGG